MSHTNSDVNGMEQGNMAQAPAELRRSERIRTMTEKGAEYQANMIEGLIEQFEANYNDWRKLCKEIKLSLKTFCTEELLWIYIQKIEDFKEKSYRTFAAIREKSQPQDIIRKQSVLEAVSKDLINVLQCRSIDDETEFDPELEKSRLRLLVSQDYAKSIYGSAVSEVTSRNSSDSATSSVSRHDLEAELIAKETRHKLDTAIDIHRAKVKELERQRDLDVLRAKLQTYDINEQRSNQHLLEESNYQDEESLTTLVTAPKAFPASSSVPNSSRPVISDANESGVAGVTLTSHAHPTSINCQIQEVSGKPSNSSMTEVTDLNVLQQKSNLSYLDNGNINIASISDPFLRNSLVQDNSTSNMIPTCNAPTHVPTHQIPQNVSVAPSVPHPIPMPISSHQQIPRNVTVAPSIPRLIPISSSSHQQIPRRVTVTSNALHVPNVTPISATSQIPHNVTVTPSVSQNIQSAVGSYPAPLPFLSTPVQPNVDNGANVLAQALHDTFTLNRLPVPMPTVFTGDPLKFIEWKSSFNSLIDKKGITASQKLHYLKQYLGGEAKEVVEGVFFRTDDDAYAQAMERLHKRYGQPFIVQRAFRKKIASWPKVGYKDYLGLRRLSDFLNSCYEAFPFVPGLRILDDCEENQKILQKLPEWITSRWNRLVHAHLDETGAYPNFAYFTSFLGKEAQIACNPISSQLALRTNEIDQSVREKKTASRSLATSSTNSSKVNSGVTKTFQQKTPQGSSQDSKKGSIGTVDAQNTVNPVTSGKKSAFCLFCKDQHSLHHCKRFLKESLEERKSFIKTNHLCFKCLFKGHGSKDCKRPNTCGICQGRHPTALHGDLPTTNMSSETSTKSKGEENKVPNVTCGVAQASAPSSDITRRSTSMIVPVWLSVTDRPNVEILVYALLDTQSDSTYVLEDSVSSLLAPKTPVQLAMSTMLDTDRPTGSNIVNDLRVRGFSSAIYIDIPSAYTQKYIPMDRAHIPTPETASVWHHLSHIASELPPLQTCDAGLLIGFDISHALLPREIISGGDTEPYGVRTDLGWTIVGGVSNPGYEQLKGIVHRVSAKELPAVSPRDFLRALESDFTSIEDDILVSQEDIQFVKIMEDGIKQRPDGHFEMPLPFKSRPCLPDNRTSAEIRLNHLKRKFAKNSDLRHNYTEFIEGMLERGEAEKVVGCGIKGETWYIPHHGVYHPKKPNKLRVVFDASAKYMGTSLNNHLLTGPDLTNELIGVLIRFRKHPVAILCDIEKMFHQFIVTESDRDFLRFLWWENGDTSKEPQDYRMKVHLFGAVSSPGCANYGLKTLAKTYERNYPLASDFVFQNFYVDDGVVSVPSEEDAIKLVQEAIDLCGKGGLRLHKFISNRKMVLEHIPASERATSLSESDLSSKELPIETVLGIQWSLEDDVFLFLPPDAEQPSTRRGILSMVASLFDPLGLLAPYILKGKRILQEMCRRGIGWDDPIPEELTQGWESWKSDQKKLSRVKIPRCYHPVSFSIARIELHHFSDASTFGYGQCSYLRFISQGNDVHCSLVFGKSRVAPSKVTTIPRLELTAAVTSVKVSVLLRKELDLQISEEVFWTDSRVVLSYICNEARRFHTFVSNRVQYIRDKTDIGQWKYVPTDQNPADYASRGLTVDEICNTSWMSGPAFLWQKDLPEPENSTFSLSFGDPEVKSARVLAVSAEVKRTLLDRLAKFSSWSLVIRVVARLKRLASKVKTSEAATVPERRYAESFVISMLQKSSYSKEIHNKNKKSSSLQALNPYVDAQGILRVGGRLENSSLPEQLKHPAIIPKDHPLTTLIIGHYHAQVKHQGKGMTMNEIRSNGLWIVGLGKAVSSYIHKCVICRKLRRQLEEQKMADLPSDRSEVAPPFTFTGMDCFGPFIVKEKRKELKFYGLLLTCMSSRAVHIEVLEDLSTDVFINALRCFIAIRGRVQVLRSDQGTNFLGAKNEFEKGLEDLDVNRLKAFLADRQCEFIMNAPHASHTGGVWERQIRTARSILSCVLQEFKGNLNASSLRTFFYEAMYIMNSRPLTTDTAEDPNSLEPLTPNHLITMKNNIALPPPGKFVQEDTYSRKRWRRVQFLAEQFWSRWRKEYLYQLNRRQKWTANRRNIQIGDIVLVCDENAPRTEWPIARVSEVFTGTDKLVRRVKLEVGTSKLDCKGRRKSNLSVLERPIQKLVVLVETHK